MKILVEGIKELPNNLKIFTLDLSNNKGWN